MKFEKLHELKKGKHAITGLCMALGFTLLTSAVYASYDDANGYQNYKEAAKRLAFKEKNVTAQMAAKVYVDGKKILATEINEAVDGNNRSTQNTNWNAWLDTSETEIDDIEIQKNGKSYNFDNIDKTYDVYEGSSTVRNGLFDFPDLEEDPAAQKAIRFMELAGDAFIGDIKNNVVLESKKDGIKNYTVSASQVQIPEVINAGVSLLGAYGLGSSNYDYVPTRYVDYQAAKEAYYKKQTGKDLPDNYYGTKDEDEIEEVLDGFYDIEKPYENKKGGVVVVYKDASTKYYPSIGQAMDDPANIGAFEEGDFIGRFFGTDAWIESGRNDFSIDSEGRLVSTDMTVVLGTKDAEGKKHEIKVVVSAKFTDYGTTEIKMPNVDDYQLIEETKDDPVIPYGDEAVLVEKKAEDAQKNVEAGKTDEKATEPAKKEEAGDKKVEDKADQKAEAQAAGN